MEILAVLAEQEGISQEQAQAVVQLLNSGNTIPFIARHVNTTQ